MMNQASTEFRLATSISDFANGRALFREYAATLDFDLSFQGFEEELASIDIKYARPEGALLLYYSGGRPAGCVAVRKLADGIAELKRLYVSPNFRSAGTGRLLMGLAIKEARELGYERIRLDTVTEMQAAIRLYEKLGFYAIEPYCFSPLALAVFMEKDLSE